MGAISGLLGMGKLMNDCFISLDYRRENSVTMHDRPRDQTFSKENVCLIIEIDLLLRQSSFETRNWFFVSIDQFANLLNVNPNWASIMFIRFT